MSLQEQIAAALDGPSDISFISWLVDDAKTLNAAIEHALLGKFDESKPEKPELLSQELVLRVYEKLDECLKDPETHELARGLQSEYILVGATLFDLACTFCKSNTERLDILLDGLCEHAPWMESEVEESSDLLVEQLEIFQEKYTKHTVTEEGSFDSEFVSKLRDDVDWYQSLTWSWLCLTEFCPLSVSALIQDSRFILELARTSDVATKLLLKLASGSHTAADNKIEECRELIKKLKWQWIALAYDVLKSLFDSAASAPADPEAAQGTNLSVLVDIIEAIETADTELTPFENAPFLLDLETRFGFKQMFTIAAAMTGQLDAAHLDYVTMTIDQLVDMTKPLYRDGIDSLLARIDNAEAPASDIDDIAAQLAAVSIDQSDDPAAVAQVKEMIPDLGDGFIRACLAHYAGSTESVVNALLENTLPPSLAEMDRTTESWVPEATDDSEETQDVLTTRRNVFDKDEFDVFHHNTLNESQVRMGKTQPDNIAEQPDDEMKSRIMDIARRIAEEDEYDDTYDDTAPDNAADPDDPIAPWEGILVAQFVSDPSALERSKDARKSAARQTLRDKTGLSDEQLEGWYIMFQKNTNQQRVLDKYAAHAGQSALERPDSAASSSSRHSRNSGYGHKEKNKAKIGNHDRKKQHARKMQNA
ncbi:hypothetical protein LPJ77_005302 [Coemansia sp. RSA 2523]|nr:hypothetical protein LPJ77_005302 [Coemansia sp. RSA 2523]